MRATTRNRTDRLRAAAALTAAAAVLLASCGGDDKSAKDADGPQEVAEGATVTAVSPLTGLDIEGDAPGHPVLAVKIDNSAASSPQVGLSKADMVTEELVEGGITRLAVFYYSEVPKTVGPVRSMRATDIGIVKPLGAVIVASGGAPQTVARFRDAEIKTFTEGATGYYRESSRYAPYNLFMKLSELARSVRSDSVPEPYLPFGGVADYPAGQPALGLVASFSGNSSSTFELRDGKYANTDSNAGADDQFLADTVLVLRVQVGDAGYRDPAGNPVPETKFTGRGQAMVFHNGRVLRAKWVKDGYDATVSLETAAGALTIPPGKVWIELVPADGGDVTIKRK